MRSSNMTLVLIKRGHSNTETDAHRENVVERLECCCHKPRNSQKLRDRPGTDLCLAFSEGAWPCQWLDLRLVLCYGSLNEQIYLPSILTPLSIPILYSNCSVP